VTTLVLFTGRRIEGTSLVDQLTRLIGKGERVDVLVPHSRLGSMVGDIPGNLHERGIHFYAIDDDSCAKAERTETPDFVARLSCGDAIKLVEGSQRILSWTY